MSKKVKIKSGLEVLYGFDGSSPHYREGIKRDKKGNYILYPGYRRLKGMDEETPGRGSRLSTRLQNTTGKIFETDITVDWEYPYRMNNHDFGYVRHNEEGDWIMVPGYRQGDTRIIYRLALKPGITHLGLLPEYNCEDCERWVKGLPSKEVKISVAGHSREKRPIWLVRIPSSNPEALNYMVQTRDHAYETAGGYCCQGMAEFLLSEDPLSSYLRSKFNFYLMPMSNPDGVYNGMSRLTWERGVNMHMVNPSAVKQVASSLSPTGFKMEPVMQPPDAAHTAVKNTLDRIRPAVYMNIHNWTNKFFDAMMDVEESIADRILQHMPPDAERYKRMRVTTIHDKLKELKSTHFPRNCMFWELYLKDEYNTIGAVFEFPWFGLDARMMREKGRNALVALALAAIEERQL